MLPLDEKKLNEIAKLEKESKSDGVKRQSRHLKADGTRKKKKIIKSSEKSWLKKSNLMTPRL